jgi:hypothetical protein
VSGLMKFMMVIISIAFLAYLNAYLSAQAFGGIRPGEATLAKRKIAV